MDCTKRDIPNYEPRKIEKLEGDAHPIAQADACAPRKNDKAMEDFTYPIELLKKEIEKLNQSSSLNAGGEEGRYHLHKIGQVFKAIEMLQKKHNEWYDKNRLPD